MSTKKYGWKKFGIFKHPKLDMTVQIMVCSLQKGSSYRSGTAVGTYGATVYDQWLENANYEALGEQIIKLIDSRTADLNWVPVLQVTGCGKESCTDINDNITNRIEIKATRYYVAKQADGRWLKVSWGTKPENRAAHSSKMYERDGQRFDQPLPFTYTEGWGHEDTITCIEYTEELWQALMNLNGKLDTLKDILQKSIQSAEGRQRLLSNTVLQLAQPEKRLI